MLNGANAEPTLALADLNELIEVRLDDVGQADDDIVWLTLVAGSNCDRLNRRRPTARSCSRRPRRRRCCRRRRRCRRRRCRCRRRASPRRQRRGRRVARAATRATATSIHLAAMTGTTLCRVCWVGLCVDTQLTGGRRSLSARRSKWTRAAPSPDVCCARRCNNALASSGIRSVDASSLSSSSSHSLFSDVRLVASALAREGVGRHRTRAPTLLCAAALRRPACAANARGSICVRHL